MKNTILPVSRPVQSSLVVPGSKSMTNRALLLAALAQGTSTLTGGLQSGDTEAFSQALRVLGVMIHASPDLSHCVVKGVGGQFPVREARLDCGEAGTAARFLLAACAASGGQYYLDGREPLRRRPMANLCKALQAQQVMIQSDALPLTVTARQPLAGGHLVVDASDSGQYISALLMAAPLARKPMMLEARHPVSQPFIDMTIAMMASFGVTVQRLGPSRYGVPVQSYRACDMAIEPDLSTAAPFFAAAAVTKGEVTVSGVNLSRSCQGDARFLALLQAMGCEVQASVQGVTVRGTKSLQGLTVDMQDCSDTFMALAAVAPFAASATTITGLRHTRQQESDRPAVMCRGLQALGVSVEQGSDWIRIYPGRPVAGEVDAAGDHRIAMAFAVLGLISGVIIQGAACVSKTCPEFFALWDQLRAA